MDNLKAIKILKRLFTEGEYPVLVLCKYENMYWIAANGNGYDSINITKNEYDMIKEWLDDK